MISIRALDIGYRNSILQKIDLDLENGKVYILIGRNGSGKSTFLKTISSEIQQISGRIELNQKDINGISAGELPKYISVVNPRFSEVDFISVYDYIALGRSPYSGILGQLSEKDRRVIEKVLNELSLTGLRSRFTNELSDGEKQLVAIARCLAQDTQNIILDEPTAFLDYRNKLQILDTLKAVAVRDNKCIILSSHDIDIAIETRCHFLLVESKQKTISLETKQMTRDEILEKAF